MTLHFHGSKRHTLLLLVVLLVSCWLPRYLRKPWWWVPLIVTACGCPCVSQILMQDILKPRSHWGVQFSMAILFRKISVFLDSKFNVLTLITESCSFKWTIKFLIVVVWVIRTYCSLVGQYQFFGRTYCSYLQGINFISCHNTENYVIDLHRFKYLRSCKI
jgi:hypothetical protein